MALFYKDSVGLQARQPGTVDPYPKQLNPLRYDFINYCIRVDKKIRPFAQPHGVVSIAEVETKRRDNKVGFCVVYAKSCFIDLRNCVSRIKHPISNLSNVEPVVCKEQIVHIDTLLRHSIRIWVQGTALVSNAFEALCVTTKGITSYPGACCVED